MIDVLTHAADAMVEHRSQVATILTWLEFAGLITMQGGNVTLTETAKEPRAEAEAGQEPEPQTPEIEEASGSGEGTTEHKRHRGDAEQTPKDTVLSFSFDLALTAEDLKALSPQQIQALFAGVGQIVAVKAAIRP